MTHPPYSKQLEGHVGGKEMQHVIDDEVAKQRHQMDEIVEEYKMKWVDHMITIVDHMITIAGCMQAQ